METQENQPNKDETIVLTTVLKEVEQLKKKVHDLETKAVVEELKLPEEDLRAAGILKDAPTRIKKGRGARPILATEIKEAQAHCDNATACAKYLDISYTCYRKWATKHGLFKTNPWGRGDRKRYWAPDKGKYPLNQILEGKFPNYPVYRLKDLVIRSGIKEAKCENCGFDEHRITDNKMPLLICFKDGDEKNHRLENIEILCYNCMFLIGRGYIHKGKVKFHFLDPDIIQGCERKIEARF